MSLREEKELQTRSQIMDAAFKLFCEHGIEATEMMQIAKKAKVSRPTLYRYFESKHQLAEMLYLSNLDHLLEPSPFNPGRTDARRFVIFFLDHILNKLKTAPLELVYDAVFNLYASRIHIDPTLLPTHPWNTPIQHQALERLEHDMQDGSIRFSGDAVMLRDTILLPYFAYVQRLAIFSFQKGNERWQETLNQAELIRNFYLETITPDGTVS